MISLLFIAKLFPIAFPPIVKDATIAATVKLTNNKLKLKVLEIPTAIVVAAAPETIPQISPITSLQKLATLSAFFLNITAILAPFTFLEFIEWKTFSSALVTETPTISKIIPIKINNKVIGVLEDYDDYGEDFGWKFSWKYGIMEYDFDVEYFSVSDKEMLWSEFENIRKKVLARVKDVLGFQYLELKHLYEAIC